MVLNSLLRKVPAQPLPAGLLNISNDLKFSFSEVEAEGFVVFEVHLGLLNIIRFLRA